MGRTFWTTMVFTLALVALVALAIWWTVFLGRAVALEREAAREALFHRAEVTALRLSRSDSPPSPGPLGSDGALELARRVEPDGEGVFALERDDLPSLAVRPTTTALEEVEARTARRRLMVAGEGALLFSLLALLVVMLYLLASQERRNLRRMESFVSAFTHELKTPLAGIKALLETIGAGRVPEQRRREMVNLGLRQTERLRQGIDKVLLSGALRAGRHRVTLDAVDLRPTVEAVIETQSAAIDDGQLELRWRPGEPITVRADAGALRIVIDNLVDNGLKYGEGRPVVVEVSVGDDQSAVVKVIDQGLGFDPGELPRLFRPFERVGADTGPPGTGLGLFIARALARRMGGEVRGDSGGNGEGATFTLTLRQQERGR